MLKFKTILMTAIALIVLLQSNVQAQETVKDGKNELKLNLLNSILALPEINYERLLNNNTGMGMAISFGIGTEEDFSQYRFLAIPHYRVYFGNKDAAGFFIEGNAAFANVREWEYAVGGGQLRRLGLNRFNFGLGAAIGVKFLTRNGFLGEVFGGAGRFLGDQKSLEAYPRVGIIIGKRF